MVSQSQALGEQSPTLFAEIQPLQGPSATGAPRRFQALEGKNEEREIWATSVQGKPRRGCKLPARGKRPKGATPRVGTDEFSSPCKGKSTKRGQRPRWAMVNGACFVRLARALPSTRAFALTGRGALRPPYPGCRSLRSLAPGYKQTRLRRVWDGLQPSPLTPQYARKPSCRTLHTSLRNSHGPWELDSQPLGIELPAAGNNVPSPWE